MFDAAAAEHVPETALVPVIETLVGKRNDAVHFSVSDQVGGNSWSYNLMCKVDIQVLYHLARNDGTTERDEPEQKGYRVLSIEVKKIAKVKKGKGNTNKERLEHGPLGGSITNHGGFITNAAFQKVMAQAFCYVDCVARDPVQMETCFGFTTDGFRWVLTRQRFEEMGNGTWVPTLAIAAVPLTSVQTCINQALTHNAAELNCALVDLDRYQHQLPSYGQVRTTET